MIKGLLVVGFIFLFRFASAQEQVTVMHDSTLVSEKQDTVLIESYASKRFNPRKALFFSAVLPGMGQVYNKKYWKVPLVYGGLIGGIYVVKVYQDNYLLYKGELFTLLNENSTGNSPSGFTQDQLRSIITKTRRQRDYFSILTSLWYILQIVDAHVDAHLKEFELNPELHVKLEPMIESDQLIGRNSGVSLKFKFR
jgi:hypothetical protein